LGRVINDRYKITGLIAKGGMGKVYRAEQAPLGRVCAVKILSPNYDGAQDPAFHQRFYLEASIASKLTHPNTVTIFDYGRTEDDVYFIAMEYLEGITLQRAIRESGPFPEDRALHIARQICRALREAHSLGVIHRDLKPANVFLLEHGDESDVVKVLDFGLVKEVGDSDDGKELTQTGLFMGSPKYMAPERVRGDKVDTTTDIYSLGIMMYEMLTGRVPFDRPNGVKILMAHVNDEPPPMRQTNPNVQPSAVYEETVMRCLAKDPAARFRTMDEVLSSLKRISGSILTASSPAIFGSSEYPSMASGVRVVNGMSGTFSGPMPMSALAQSAPWDAALTPIPETSSKRKWWIGGAVAGALLVAGVAGGLVIKARHARAVASSAAASTAGIGAAVRTTEAMAAPSPAAVRGGDLESFHLTLNSEPPEATVELAGKPVGQTPLMIDLFPGPQTFVVMHDGYLTATIVATVTEGMAGQTQSRTLTLVPRKGSLSGNTAPRVTSLSELRVAPSRPAAQPSLDRAERPNAVAAPAPARTSSPFDDPPAETPAPAAAPPAAVTPAPAPAPVAANPPPVAAAAPTVIPFGGDMARPTLLSGNDPVWPREALVAGVEGVMLVKCTITTSGTVQNCRILKSLPYMDKAVTDSLMSRRYTPVTYHGSTVAVDYIFSVRLKQR
jgi:serine/threonine-protein kinase